MSATSVAQTIGDTWVSKEPIQHAVFGLRAVAVNGKIYTLAAYGNQFNFNEEYNPVTNTWTAKEPMPTARTRFGIAVVENKIYTIGGAIDNTNTGVVEVYDPATNTWETKSQMPTNRSQLNANVVDGKIYMIGGTTGGSNPIVGVTEVYDPSTNSWLTKKPMPYSVDKYASAVIDGKIYVIGGEGNDQMQVDFNQVYNPETDTWSFGTPVPNEIRSAAAGATTGTFAPKRIYIIGGLSQSAMATNSNYIYDPETDSWDFGVSMPTARCDLAVAVVDDLLYAIGGVPGYSIYSYNTENEMYVPLGHIQATQAAPAPPDTAPPEITFTSPENNTAYTTNNVSLTFTVNEAASWTGYSLDEQENVTITGNTTLTGLTDGEYSLRVYANDTSGNMGGSQTVCFTVALPWELTPQVTIAIAATATTAVITAASLLLLRNKKQKTAKENSKPTNP